MPCRGDVPPVRHPPKGKGVPPMAKPSERDRDLARRGRTVALVIAGTMIFWLGAQALGGRLGWEARYVFLFDLMALAGFFWAFVVTFQIWRQRRGE